MRRFFLQIVNAMRPHRTDADVARELASHLALLEDEYTGRGMTSDAARRAARLALGGVEQTKELHRDARSFTWMDGVGRDLRYALRTLARARAFTTVAILTLALGIGANTAVFSITHAVLLRPLAYREPERLVAIWGRFVREQGMSKLFVQYRDLERWQERSRSFDELAAVTWATSDRILTGQGLPRNVLAIPATGNLFSLLGVPAWRGRTFDAGDRLRGCTLVLSHRFWQDVLGGPADLARLALSLDAEACTVVGVMPPGFVFFPEPTAMWRLITPNDALVRIPERSAVGVFGRLHADVTLPAAEAELKVLSAQINEGRRYGTEMEPRVYPLQQEFTFLAGPNLRRGIIVLFGAVSFVLLIACVNVANLLLGRSLVRRRELAIRTALGSGRGRLIRQLLVESLVLSSAGAALGALIATAALAAFRRMNPIELPPGVRVEMSLPVLGFTLLLVSLTTVMFGLLPAFRAARVDPQAALRGGGPGAAHGRTRSALARSLIVAEVSLSSVLLVGAGLFVESAVHFAAAPLGFEPRGLVTVTLTLPPDHYGSPAQRIGFFDRVLNELASAGDAAGLALSTVLPLRSGRGSRVLSIEGRPDPAPGNAVHDIGTQSVTPDYFAVMHMARLRGRSIAAGDREGSMPVAVVNDSLVRRYFAGEDPIGRRIRFYNEPADGNPWLTIVGVVADEKRTTPYDEMAWADPPVVYQPLAQKAAQNEVHLLLRTAQRSAGQNVQQAIARIDPGIVVGEAQPAERLIDRYVAHPWFRAALLAFFAALAVLLAAVGLYAVLAQFVAQRTHEIGIRMALGARSAEIMGLVLGESAALTVIGVGLGLGAAAGVSRLLGAMLFGVTPLDLGTFTAAALVFIAAAAAASAVPVRRATEVDPLIAIRHE